ncbi:hypothetical protein Tco_0909508 [Tanacetum coccineum]|uniref:Uncharacterized protein n=1 Tax=Tanacetum coccineum TaxID=301880 RepID=A0ABQ5CTG9_9ASTR
MSHRGKVLSPFKNVSVQILNSKHWKQVSKLEANDKSVVEPSKSDEEEPPKEVDKTNERRADDEPAKSAREKVTKNEEEEPTGVSSSQTEVTNRIACRKYFQVNECEIFTEAGDGVEIFPDGVRLYLMRRNPEVLRSFMWMILR